MKKQFIGFVAGVFTTVLVLMLIAPAIADSLYEVRFNTVNVDLNGEQVIVKNENQKLSNEVSVPGSIMYIDEKGGGSTYLPIRKISELLGLNVSYDNSTSTVILESEAYTKSKPQIEMPAWSDAEIKQYQEFRNMWDIEFATEVESSITTTGYWVIYNGDLDRESLRKMLKSYDSEVLEGYIKKMLTEVDRRGKVLTELYFVHPEAKTSVDLIIGVNYSNSTNLLWWDLR